jgi:hypothetical protein
MVDRRQVHPACHAATGKELKVPAIPDNATLSAAAVSGCNWERIESDRIGAKAVVEVAELQLGKN